MKKVLFLGCHCDDIELGCGATINKYRDTWEMYCVVLSPSGPKGLYPDLRPICRNALSYLGISTEVRFLNFETVLFEKDREVIWERLFDLNKEIKPDCVFTQEADEQQDHVTLFNETLRNFKNKNVFTYRSSIRSCPVFKSNYWEIVNHSHVQSKVKALEFYEMYQSKLYMKPDNVISQLRVDGTYIEAEYAETYRAIRFIA